MVDSVADTCKNLKEFEWDGQKWLLVAPILDTSVVTAMKAGDKFPAPIYVVPSPWSKEKGWPWSSVAQKR